MCIYYIPCNTSNHISTSAFEDGELESFPKTNSFAREKRSGCKKKVLPSWGLAQVQRCELLVPKSEKRLAVPYTKGRPLSNTDAQTVAPISALLRSRNRSLPKLSGGKLLHVFSIQYLKTNNPVETHCLLCLSYMKNTNHPSILPRIVELSTTIFHQSSHVHLDHQRQVASGGSVSPSSRRGQRMKKFCEQFSHHSVPAPIFEGLLKILETISPSTKKNMVKSSSWEIT